MEGVPRDGFNRYAGVAAAVVGIAAILYTPVFFLIPKDQKGVPPDSLVSFHDHPTARILATLLLVIGALAASLAVVGLYRWLRDTSPSWALWSLVLGAMFTALTVMSAVYQLFTLVALSRKYATGDPGLQAAAIVGASIPSPLDTYGFAHLLLGGIWLQVVGLLMLRSKQFWRLLGYLAFISGFGTMVLFIATIAEQAPRSIVTTVIIYVTALTGSVVAPLFWLGAAYAFWKKE